MQDLMRIDPSVPTVSPSRPFVFISDLHFDHRTSIQKGQRTATAIRNEFIALVKHRYADSILCLAGDFFSQYQRTLEFVQELERERVVGFFVLGNHDYWNDGTHTHEDIIDLFTRATHHHQYFRLLVTGRTYHIDDLCIIGDTGWTSFRRNDRQVVLKPFMELPDAKLVKNFHPKIIKTLHAEWIAFANKVLQEEEKVLIITHFPMVNFTNKDRDCWWSSSTALKGNNSWRIFGHTHQNQHDLNNISCQYGYGDNDVESERLIPAYRPYTFGTLKKQVEETSIAVTPRHVDDILQMYSPARVSHRDNALYRLDESNHRGYQRCAANKRNFCALASDPMSYIRTVKKIIDGYSGKSYIGYEYDRYQGDGLIPSHWIQMIQSSLVFLQSGDTSDIRTFVTAAVITGYVFNQEIFYLMQMRTLDDDDVFRFWLMLLTIQTYRIDMNDIQSVRGNNKKRVVFRDRDMPLPTINGHCLDPDRVRLLMHRMSWIAQPVALLPSEQRPLPLDMPIVP